MTVLTAKAEYLDFSPGLADRYVDSNDAQTILARAIIEGSGGPDNFPITLAGLRFIRYLLCILPADSFGLPNFKNMDTINAVARYLVQRHPSQALQNMQAVMYSADDFIVDWQ